MLRESIRTAARPGALPAHISAACPVRRRGRPGLACPALPAAGRKRKFVAPCRSSSLSWQAGASRRLAVWPPLRSACSTARLDSAPRRPACVACGGAVCQLMPPPDGVGTPVVLTSPRDAARARLQAGTGRSSAAPRAAGSEKGSIHSRILPAGMKPEVTRT